MIDWIPPVLLGLLVIAILAAMFFIYMAYLIVAHEDEEKCPFCGRWTKDKGYRKQDCDHCGMMIVYADHD